MAGPNEMSGGQDHARSLGPEKLNRIADLLGITVEKLSVPSEPRVLHTDHDGTSWLLICDCRGIPIVRRIGSSAEGEPVIEERVSAFLARAAGSPQGDALVALIEGLLTTHLAVPPSGRGGGP